MSSNPTSTTRQWNYVAGVGQVPSGPRGHINAPFAAERVVRIDTGSVAVVPKVEEVDAPLATIPRVEVEGRTPDISPGDKEIKAEESVHQESPAELPESFMNNLQRLFSDNKRGFRGESDGSRRQHIDESTTRRRSARGRFANSRGHTQSPVPFRTPSASGSNRQSPMFFPERQRSQDLSSEDTSLRRSVDSGGVNSPSTSDTLLNDTNARNDDENGTSRCQCPISYPCSCRSANLLDCRPLVREWPSWKERRDQEAFDMHRMAPSHGDNTTTLETIGKIVDIVKTFEQSQTPARRETAVQNIENWILAMEDVTLTAGPQQDAASQHVVPYLTQFLHSENLQARQAGRVPTYIEEELAVIKIKWERGDFDGSIRRGLTAVTTYDVNGIPKYTRTQVDREWPHLTSGLYFGAGNLVNGQIWLSRAELQRDGVHAPPIAGISGTTSKGAYSIVLGAFDEKKNEGYADIDGGNAIDYMGTALKDEEGLGPTNVQDPHMGNPEAWNMEEARTPTVGTRALMKSLETKRPVRVIRSWKMCKIVHNKPGKGYRYDGLYQVVGMTALKERRQIWSFRLERLDDQGRLRGVRLDGPPLDLSGRRKGHFYRTRR